MAAFNRCRVSVRSAWLLLLESQRACLACIENGQWAAVRNIKGAFDGPEQWAELLDRERYLAGGSQPGADVMVHAAPEGPFDPSTLRPFDKLRAQGSGLRTGEAGPAEAGAWRFRPLIDPVLPGFSPIEDRRFAMALCAH
jgi:hypothetical protein